MTALYSIGAAPFNLAVHPGNGAQNRAQRRAQRSRRHRQIIGGQRAAAVRALTAARLRERGEYSSRLKAARACGSNVRYVAAMEVLLQAENAALIERVVDGKIGLLEAADACQRIAALVRAYRQAFPTEQADFGKTVGVAKLFDEAVAPTLT